MNLASFRVAFPTFVNVGDPRVTQALADAATRCNAEVFGARYDQAQGLLAAHLIQCDPGGQSSRLESDNLESTYGKEFRVLTLAATCMIRTF